MSDDLNPVQWSDQLPESSSGALARALEELLAKQSAGASAAVEDMAAAASGALPPDTAGPCPAPGEWSRLLGGELGASEADALLDHAAVCRGCAEHLRAISADPSLEEADEISKLASASRDWQHSLAAELARTPHLPARDPAQTHAQNPARESARDNEQPPLLTPAQNPAQNPVQNPVQNKAPRFYLWAGAAMAATLVFAAVLVVWWQRANTPERLLAEAYTHSRIFDLRMPGAGFAEVTPTAHLRGSATGRESARLLDARARIERHLESAPQDTHWLQLEARADLLEENFDPAIDILDRLLATEPVTSSLLVDDAAAYFQRGTATGSENDRATALEYLRRADELAPGDTVVLFNEAVVMEDRGQVMNAVETWNRYLRFERDPRWMAEGRRRLQAIEQKLNRLKTHQSRMDQRLATPQAMRALAADPAALAEFDEELSTYLLPRLLNAAFPMPVDRSRGSPCAENCQAALILLRALAESLERNHQDPWLTLLLPSHSSPPDLNFLHAVHALAQAMDADVLGDYPAARQGALQARRLFHRLGIPAGEDRAGVEWSFALLRSSDYAACYRAAHPILNARPQFAWIQIYDLLQDTYCDPAPGTAAENNPGFLRAIRLAHDRRYTMLEIRARNLLGAPAAEAGDSETTWRIYLPTLRGFYSGDFPPMRLYGTLSGLQEAEQATPRVRVALLMQREVVGVLELTESWQLIATERLNLASVAMRAGSIQEAEDQMRRAHSELAANGGGESVKALLAENEMHMANLYLDRRDLTAAAKMLDAAQGHMAGENNSNHRLNYAVARGQLELAEGQPKTAEPLLRDALLEEERLAGKDGAPSIVLAQQDREPYAVLTGVWLAQGRSGDDALALWERYRLRILGVPAPSCPNRGLACLQPKLSAALKRLGPDRALGQVILFDRVLLYSATSQGVVWTQVPMRREDVLATAAPLERAVNSPATPMYSVDQAARRVGGVLLAQLATPNGTAAQAAQSAAPAGDLLLEPDPLLGNLPWPSVETAAGPIGLQFNLEESPSLALDRRPGDRDPAPGGPSPAKISGKPLIVGASIASPAFSGGQSLPEVLYEARAVARFGNGPDLLLGDQATQAQVAAHLATASAIHFAGHATQQDGATRLLLAPAKVVPAGPNPTAARPPAAGPDKPWLDSDLLRRHPPKAARLAVFSACSTGKNEEGWNHGMGDILGTLASLGVPDVVATRWQIDSASAVPMMDAFYGGLAKGLTVPQALTAARQNLIRDPRYRHPYYWAAWYASGWGKSDLRPVFHAGN